MTTVVAAGMLSAPAAGALTGAASNSYAFTARLDIGDGQRACSGTLVYTDWLLTAASCFAADPAVSLDVPAGAPAPATTATIGRADLTGTAGQVRSVVELVPHPDQDLVLARLATPVTGITPVGLATTAPTDGETLTAAGYGRTVDEWAPLHLHSGTFKVDSAAATEVSVTGQNGAAVCAGDTGGPLVRDVNGTPQLVGINSRSWQGGCFGSDKSETRTGAVATRIDKLRTWIGENAGPVCNAQGVLYSATTAGSLLRRNVDDPAGGSATVPEASTIDTGWDQYGRVLAGPGATFYGVKSDGLYLSHRVSSTATWDVHHQKISSDLGTYAQAANHNKITVDRSEHIWYVDGGGDLRFQKYDRTTATWDPQGNKKIDSGWGAYTHIFAGDDGVVFGIDSATGHLVRSRYDFESQRWIEHQETVSYSDWRDTKEITSWGGDTVIRVKPSGEIRYYRYNEGTGVFGTTWNKLIGSGTHWAGYTSISGAPDSCRLRGDHTPDAPAVDTGRTSGPAVLQTSTGEIAYATTDATGRLMVGRQTDPADASTVQWTTGPATELFAGQPQLSEQPDGRIALSAHTPGGDTQWRRRGATDGVWGSWVSLAGAMKGHPALARTAAGVLVEFAVDADGHPWYRAQQRANVDFMGWVRLSGDGFAGPLTAVAVRSGIQLFGTGSDGQVRTATFTDGVLGAWSTVGDRKVTGAVSAVVYGDYRVGVFARGEDGTVLSAVQGAENAAFPAAWTPVADLTATGTPSAVIDPASGYTQVLARAADGTLRRSWEAALNEFGTWQPSVQAGSEVSATDPTAFAYTAGTSSKWAFAFRTDSGSVRVTPGS
ncbi:tachylectin-related carbohydrate-binding protein [Streptomyces sp. MMS24-I2-30]|uniref:tachylectin-related carbohydrate-binding protein n=1 Tax=Streptomyces sp. MMS24-I2-30 TaxID=3351564 RepID=UPI003896E959